MYMVTKGDHINKLYTIVGFNTTGFPKLKLAII